MEGTDYELSLAVIICFVAAYVIGLIMKKRDENAIVDRLVKIRCKALEQATVIVFPNYLNEQHPVYNKPIAQLGTDFKKDYQKNDEKSWTNAFFIAEKLLVITSLDPFTTKPYKAYQETEPEYFQVVEHAGQFFLKPFPEFIEELKKDEARFSKKQRETTDTVIARVSLTELMEGETEPL